MLTEAARQSSRIFLLAAAMLASSCAPAPKDELANSQAAATGAADFEEAAASVGLSFHATSGATGRYLFPEIMCAGVGLIDFDNDGDLDVVLLQGAVLDPKENTSSLVKQPPPGWRPGARLFRNLLAETKALRFEDVTERMGFRYAGFGMGMATGDYDNDGFTDLYLTGFEASALLRNRGGRGFEDVTLQARASVNGWTAGAAFADYDRDGWLDLYVARYVRYSLSANVPCKTLGGEPDYCGPQVYPPTPDALLHNSGRHSNGTVQFVDVSNSAGIATKAGPGLGVSAADFNGDGWPDFLVANDGSANHLWLNESGKTFTESALEAGVAYNADGTVAGNMGLAVADVDGDGNEDALVTHLPEERSALYVHSRTGQFYDAAARFGITQGSLGRTGFGAEWLDFDNDGDLDLFVANGAVRIREEQIGAETYPFLERNQLFERQGDRYADISERSTSAFSKRLVGRGAAIGDIDNDGLPDIVASSNNGQATVYRNRASKGNHWLSMSLRGVLSNRSAIGARVEIITASGKKQWRRVHSDGSYCSASDLRVHFGLGMESGPVTVRVSWPSRMTETWRAVKPDRISILIEGSGAR